MCKLPTCSIHHHLYESDSLATINSTLSLNHLKRFPFLFVLFF